MDDDEFELRYQEEMEMMDEEYEDAMNQVQISNLPAQRPNAPELSQILTAEEIGVQNHNPVNRRLFATPTTTEGSTAMNQFQHEGLHSKRRLEEIVDVDKNCYQNATGDDDPMNKKAKMELQRDLEDIEKIVNIRRRMQDNGTSNIKETISRLTAIRNYKIQNMSSTIPAWQSLMVRSCNSKCIYLRYHSEQYETNEINRIQIPLQKNYTLSETDEILTAALKILSKNTDGTQSRAQEVTNHTSEINPIVSKADYLWVDKYKPKKYLDLLSDESANRSLLYWLKMWDKVVFGREFKPKVPQQNPGVLNSFNRRAGKFESNGGWRKYKKPQNLNQNLDEFGRPAQKVVLLNGPPGVGKTTLAHLIARHAGYVAREINASDDRSPENWKLALESGTQMMSLLNEDQKPNCIILDEIDGAPKRSIEFLVKFVTDSCASSKSKANKEKKTTNMLKRPIICICNDLYEPALRPLRQIAFVITFPAIESTRLAERLMQVAYREKLKTDFETLLTLAEISGCDVRSCMSTMQFFNSQEQALKLQDVLNHNLGHKDRHQGLFDIWGAIFKIPQSKRVLEHNENDENDQVILADLTLTARAQNILEMVHSSGNYEKLIDGVYENFMHQKVQDFTMAGTVEAMEWFGFTDLLYREINHSQNYSIYPYLQFGFIKWHFLFASLARPKINFPLRSIEFKQKSATHENIFHSFINGISLKAYKVGCSFVILNEIVPFLKHILTPRLRTMPIQLLSLREQADLRQTVEIMLAFGLTYKQHKTVEGASIFNMEPDLYHLQQFPDTQLQLPMLNNFSRQLISREVEHERFRLTMPKIEAGGRSKIQQTANHLQRLKAKQLGSNENAKAAKQMFEKDIFGRLILKKTAGPLGTDNSDPIVKSPIWYRHKEGFNNAVRTDIITKDLL